MGSLRDVWFELGADTAGGISPWLIRAMVATCRVTCQSRDVLDRARRDAAFIGVLWHQDLVFFGDHARRPTILATQRVARSARASPGLGCRPCGSSSRGAEEALELIEIARRGECIGFVADGAGRAASRKSGRSLPPSCRAADRADGVRDARRPGCVLGPHARASSRRSWRAPAADLGAARRERGLRASPAATGTS
jgi:hypothetical protein